MKRLVPSITILLVLVAAATVTAQTNQFAFQGALNNSGVAANGNYDFEFALFDSLNGGFQIAGVLARNNVAVVNGIFVVKLDFGAAFSGDARFLEIRVRQTGQPGMTVLAPRQQIDSSPYSIRSLTALNANSIGGQSALNVANAVIAVNSATPANTPNTLVMRTVNGDLSASTFFATQQYNIGAFRVLGINGPNNIFVGVNAGLANSTGSNNSFVGNSAGRLNTTGGSNSFFGAGAGDSNTTGLDNSFFGHSAGQANNASHNSFFGRSAGESNTTGSRNSFFGKEAGLDNTAGTFNSFFGNSAGLHNTTGNGNSFFGSSSGFANTTASGNSFFGNGSGQNTSTGESNSFFGSGAGFTNTVGFANSFFGRDAGESNTTGGNNSFFGMQAGRFNTNGFNNSFFGVFSGDANVGGFNNSFFGINAGGANTSGSANSFFGRSTGSTNTTGSNNTLIGDASDVGAGNLSYATAIGADAVVSTSNTVVLGRTEDIVRIPGFLRVVQLGSPGATSLCQNVNDTISTCSSSIRYKSNISGFTSGLSLIDRLRPVSFNWKDGGMLDMGLVAEEVAEVEPLLVTTNKQGEIEGVKYDRVGVVLVNAVKEQQAQIEAQAETIRRQQQQIDALMKLVCVTNASADMCGKDLRKEK